MSIDMGLSLNLIFKLFDFDHHEVGDCDLVIINLNSVFSTTFYPEMIEEFMDDEDKMQEYVGSISEMFKMVITKFDNQRIILVYSPEVSNFIDVYENWRMERYQNKEKNEFAKIIYNHFINTFNKIDDINPTINIINSKRFDPVIFTHAFINIRGYEKEVFLISRDRMDFLNLENENLTMYDGQQFYTKETFKDHEVGKLPNIDIRFLKYYYRLRGIYKYDYPGVRGYGEKRSVRYIKKNLSKLVDGEDKHIDEEFVLFDFGKFIANLSEDDYNDLLDIINGCKF